MRIYVYTYILIYIYTYRYMYMYTYIHMYKTYIHVCNIHSYAYTHLRIHIYIHHTYTHTHVHTYIHRDDLYTLLSLAPCSYLFLKKKWSNALHEPEAILGLVPEVGGRGPALRLKLPPGQVALQRNPWANPRFPLKGSFKEDIDIDVDVDVKNLDDQLT